YAGKLIKEKKFRQARDVLDRALAVRPLDPAVRYTRGLVFEKNHEWDSAYVYQSKYQPSLLEEKEYKAHMNALRTRTLHNTVDAGVDVFRFTNASQLMVIASVGYDHNWKRDEFSSRINFTGRDAEYDQDLLMYTSAGGRGLQFLTSWTHHFGTVFSLKLGGSFGTRYFPIAGGDLSGTVHWKNDWDTELGLNFRYLLDHNKMYAASLGASHTGSHIYVGAKVMGGTVYNVWFVNGSARLRFYPFEGGKSYVEAQAGAGTAPEIQFLNYYQNSAAFNNLNSFAAFTASWAVTHNLAIQFSGTWNTLYDQRSTVSYRNLLMAHVSVAITF
ncbi:MAG: hypothetical protein IJV63_06675, partial [Bacteroidales bacterium]|nr:hypothetical protein [Bacteroidales bacterium]